MSETSDQVAGKKPMTDEERQALCAKMDQELEDFIGGLEKTRYTDGWPEDRWEEEMDKHPFFMKTPPKEGEELHPMLEGMRQLKYDPMENTLEDLAHTYRDDGNFNMKHKNYRMAVYSYTEGIKQKCQNDEINATLLNNRSAAHFFIHNYRSSYEDAKRALSLKPDYEKAAMRQAQCTLHLNRYEECIDLCAKYVDQYGLNDKIAEVRKKAREANLQKLHKERKQASNLRKKVEAVSRTIAELTKRGIKFEEQTDKSRIQDLMRPVYVPLEEFPIHIEEVGDGLIWPAVFCYPEFELCDFQQALEDGVVMYDILVDLFAERMEFDTHYRYKPNTVNIYFENKILGKVFPVNPQQTIQQITSHKNFLVSQGVLTFHAMVKNSDAEKEFLQKIRRPITITRTPFDA